MFLSPLAGNLAEILDEGPASEGEDSPNAASAACCLAAQLTLMPQPGEVRPETSDSPGKLFATFPNSDYKKNNNSASYLPIKAMASGKNCERFWLQ